MALLLLIVIGATGGWLASIIARTEAPGSILRQIGLGALVALIAGLLVNQGTIIGGLSLLGLGVSIAATGFALVVYHAILQRRADA